MPSLYAFSPGNSALVTASSGSSNAVALPTGAGTQLRLLNDGTGTVFFAVTTAAGAATVAASTPILAGATEIFITDPAGTHMAAITSAGTSSMLRVTRGEGQ